jgi:hypothetical protein
MLISSVVTITGPSEPQQAQPEVAAYLFNPSVEEIVLHYLYERPPDTLPQATSLVVEGRHLDFDGSRTLSFVIESPGGALHQGDTVIAISDGWFETEVRFPHRGFVAATGIRWSISGDAGRELDGYAPLLWSHFRGTVEYRAGGWSDTRIELVPVNWGAPGTIIVPVHPDGSFDAYVPSRVYAAVIVVGTGYTYDSLERWAWNYDLTRDRQDTFTIGRTELYGMRAFEILGGPPTILVLFRPSALSRVLAWDLDHDGNVSEVEMQQLAAAMADSSMVLAPELDVSSITVRLDGEEQQIVRLDRIPEYDGGSWQAQYVVQIFPDAKPKRGVWHEILVEVSSRELLNGEVVVDYGQGSVGFYRP